MSLHKILKVMFGRVMFTLLCVGVQIGWMFALWTTFHNYSALCSFIVSFASIIAVIGINSRSENSAGRLVWTIIILVFPIFGLCLYSMFASQGITKRKKIAYDKVNKTFLPYLLQDTMVMDSLREENLFVHNQEFYIQSQSTYPAYQNTAVNYFGQTEDALEAMLEDMENAKEFIFLEYFAVENEEVWKRIEEVLVRKAAEGVEVRFIYDDFGSIGYVKPEFAKQLNKKGIKCRIFNPLVPAVYIFMNHRDHRKITVIDNKISYSGGYNIADEYFNIVHPYGHWKDSGIRLEGDAVNSHTVMFLQMWNSIIHSDRDYSRFLKPFEGSLSSSQGYVQPYSDTPLDKINLGENVYMNILKNATDYVYITTPYLIIDTEMERELCLAAQRGIDVRIITPNIPDKKTVFLLTQSYYNKLIQAGVRIYQYTPGFIHAKNFICDDNIAVVGTINMDYRSLYLHFECATYLYNTGVEMDIKADFIETMAKSHEITLEDCLRRKPHTRMLQAFLRLFSPMA